MAAIESKLLIATGGTSITTPIDLSEQQVLDCAGASAGLDSKGCSGGYLMDPFIYASRCEGWDAMKIVVGNKA